MYIKREVDDILFQWKKEEHRKPVILRGVRQCGKTSAVRFLSKNFNNYIELNLEKQPSLCALFNGDIDVKKIVMQLELRCGKKIDTNETLLFIDEIQECPRAITALRYFYEDMPNLHVVAAGSLLEFVLNGKRKESVDFPVGRVRSIYMYPFSFAEFLRGTGREKLCDYLMGQEILHGENLAHEQLTDAYKEFLIVGGMPEAVMKFAQTGSLYQCQNVHRDIITNFKDDFNKYSTSVPSEILHKVFEYALHNVCNQVKASSAIPGISAYYFEESVSLLHRAGLIYPIKASPCDTIPFGSTEKETNKKLIFFDSGIYLTECGLDTETILATSVFEEMNKGAVVEMATGLELIKNSSPASDTSLHYWYRTGANAETDYVIAIGNNAVPIEVKASGSGGMQSIRVFLSSHTNSCFGVRVSLESFAHYDNIFVFPVYAVNRLRNSELLKQ